MSKIDKAMRILLAGFCINLCLGILYAWSVFNKALVTTLAGVQRMPLPLMLLQPSLFLSVF